MEKPLFEILDILKASPADYFIFLMGMLVVLYLIFQSKRIKKLEHDNRQLDKLVLVHAHIIASELKVRTVKIHRSGDFEIAQPINEVE